MSDEAEGPGDDDRTGATGEECEAPEEQGDGDAVTTADEYREAFGTPHVAHVIADDGLPAPVIPDLGDDAHAPAFLPEENQICVAITSSFVIRDRWGYVLFSWPEDKVGQTPNGLYRARVADAEPGPGVEIASPFEEARWCKAKLRILRERGARYAEYGDVEDHPEAVLVTVEPVRPACRNLLLQLLPPAPSMAHVLKHGDMHRYCMIKRSISGAFFGLKDEAMRACSGREPPDLVSIERLRKFDRDLEKKSRERSYHNIFADGEEGTPHLDALARGEVTPPEEKHDG